MEPCNHKTVEPSCEKCMKDAFEYELRLIVVGEAMAALGPHWAMNMTYPKLKAYLEGYIAAREPQLRKQLDGGE